jgi:hypothetical protein
MNNPLNGLFLLYTLQSDLHTAVRDLKKKKKKKVENFKQRKLRDWYNRMHCPASEIIAL